MSITDQLHRAYFPAEYADILMRVLTIGPGNFLNVKDALFHFRCLDDSQASEVMEQIGDRLDSEE